MKSLLCSVIVTVIISSVTLAQKGLGPSPRAGQLVVPDSSRERPENLGVRAHTNHLIFKPATGKPVGGGGPQGETPQSIRSVYNLPSTGGSGIIAIVDAYHYPT